MTVDYSSILTNTVARFCTSAVGLPHIPESSFIFVAFPPIWNSVHYKVVYHCFAREVAYQINFVSNMYNCTCYHLHCRLVLYFCNYCKKIYG